MFASTLYVPGLNSRAKRCVPNWFSFWVLKTLFSEVWMLEADMLGSKTNTFGPRFGVFDWAGQVPLVPTIQLNVADPEAPVVSVAVTVTLVVAAVVGVPVMSPEDEEIDSPAGRPVAL